VERRGSGATDLKSSKVEKLPSTQTMTNLERTIRSFNAVVKYIINEGKDCPVKPTVNAKRISQDLLENHNSKHRGKSGDNKHPDLAQTLLECDFSRRGAYFN